MLTLVASIIRYLWDLAGQTFLLKHLCICDGQRGRPGMTDSRGPQMITGIQKNKTFYSLNAAWRFSRNKREHSKLWVTKWAIQTLKKKQLHDTEIKSKGRKGSAGVSCEVLKWRRSCADNRRNRNAIATMDSKALSQLVPQQQLQVKEKNTFKSPPGCLKRNGRTGLKDGSSTSQDKMLWSGGLLGCQDAPRLDIVIRSRFLVKNGKNPTMLLVIISSHQECYPIGNTGAISLQITVLARI